MARFSRKILLTSFLLIAVGAIFLWEGFNSKPADLIQTASTLPTPQPVASSAAALAVQSDKVKVIKVIDGDTIEIAGGAKVRYLGLDTPETVDPRRPVGCFGKEASNKNKELVEGKEIILEKDVEGSDKYNRLLRYVYLPLDQNQLLFVNDYLIREGFAKIYTKSANGKFTEQFRQAEQQARVLKKGLWGKCQ